jgi:MFS transporter, AAHS family, 4-hydroxybenzoate transporter
MGLTRGRAVSRLVLVDFPATRRVDLAIVHSLPADTSATPVKRSAAIITLGFCGLVALLDGADSQSAAIAAPLIANEIGIQKDALGAVFSIGLAGAALGAVTFGPLADRFGAKRMLVFSTLLFGAFTLATAYVDTYLQFLIVRLIAGVGLGGATPCFLTLAASCVPAKSRARLLGFMWACFPLGGVLGGIVNGWFVENRPWQSIFIFGGALPIIVALAVLFAVRVDPRQIAGPKTDGRFDALWADGRLRARVLLTWAVFFAAFGSLAGIVTWMPTLLVHVGLKPSAGAAVLAWNSLGALVSMALAGLLVEKLKTAPIIFGLAGGAVLTGAMSLAFTSFGATAACMIAAGILLGVAASGAIALAGTLFPPALQASGLGWSMGAGRLGQMTLPFLMGLQFARTESAAVVMFTAAAFPAVGAVAALALHNLNRRIAARGM